jgi:hypothetical protein
MGKPFRAFADKDMFPSPLRFGEQDRVWRRAHRAHGDRAKCGALHQLSVHFYGAVCIQA